MIDVLDQHRRRQLLGGLILRSSSTVALTPMLSAKVSLARISPRFHRSNSDNRLASSMGPPRADAPSISACRSQSVDVSGFMRSRSDTHLIAPAVVLGFFLHGPGDSPARFNRFCGVAQLATRMSCRDAICGLPTQQAGGQLCKRGWVRSEGAGDLGRSGTRLAQGAFLLVDPRGGVHLSPSR